MEWELPATFKFEKEIRQGQALFRRVKQLMNYGVLSMFDNLKKI